MYVVQTIGDVAPAKPESGGIFPGIDNPSSAFVVGLASGVVAALVLVAILKKDRK